DSGPEQAGGEKEIDGRSDLYSLGIVSYQMLTGELPFNAPSVAGILMKQIGEMAGSIQTLRTGGAEDLDLPVTRCLEKDPENRWPSADALRRALESRTVTDYRPTGQTRGQSRSGLERPSRSSAGRPLPRQAPAPLPGPPRGRDDWRSRLDRHTQTARRRKRRREGTAILT